MDTSAPADTDMDEQVARAESLAAYAIRQAEIKAVENVEIAKQQARQLLHEKTQTHIQQNAQDQAQAAAMIQQVQREAQGVTHEAHGAI